MKIKYIALLILSFAFTGLNVDAQSTGAVMQKALDELAILRTGYTQAPVQMLIHLKNEAAPYTHPTDTMQTDMTVYNGHGESYVQSEGLEEIINDSLIIMVNNAAKQITVIPKVGDTKQSTMLLMDSSAEYLARNYSIVQVAIASEKKRIELTSTHKLYGTDVAKEFVTITYQPAAQRLEEITQTHRGLLPIDSAVYGRLLTDDVYKGKLTSMPTNSGTIYFLVKETTTTYAFKRVDKNPKHPPAKQEDRIARQTDGSYVPVKGMEDYLLSSE